MLESEKYGFHAPTPEPILASSTELRVAVKVFTLGLTAENIGIPTLTVLHKFVVSVQPGLAPLFMPKFTPKSVIVAAELKGADGLGFRTPVLVLEMDEISGAEYRTPFVIEPMRSLEPHDIIPDLVALMPPRRPDGILIRIELSEIQ